MKHIFFFITTILLTGCWAISDLRTNREMDRTLPANAIVESTGFRARTPESGLLIANAGKYLKLRSYNIGTGTPNFFSVALCSKSTFDDRIHALSDTAEGRVVKAEHYSAHQFYIQKNGELENMYLVYLERSGKGIVIQQSTFHSPSAAKGHWLSTFPDELVRFVNSVEVKD